MFPGFSQNFLSGHREMKEQRRFYRVLSEIMNAWELFDYMVRIQRKFHGSEQQKMKIMIDKVLFDMYNMKSTV